MAAAPRSAVPACAGDGAGNGGERLVGAALPVKTVGGDGDDVLDTLPLTDQPCADDGHLVGADAALFPVTAIQLFSKRLQPSHRFRLQAEQMVAQNLVPAATSNVVPQSIRTLAPISEPRLDAASETAWYLAASPNQIDTIEYAYLEGQQGAYIETRNGFDVDGVEIKCRLDFGAKAIDWRGLYKNPGA